MKKTLAVCVLSLVAVSVMAAPRMRITIDAVQANGTTVIPGAGEGVILATEAQTADVQAEIGNVPEVKAFLRQAFVDEVYKENVNRRRVIALMASRVAELAAEAEANAALVTTLTNQSAVIEAELVVVGD